MNAAVKNYLTSSTLVMIMTCDEKLMIPCEGLALSVGTLWSTRAHAFGRSFEGLSSEPLPRDKEFFRVSHFPTSRSRTPPTLLHPHIPSSSKYVPHPTPPY
jgi:hypothetical protein